jgi:hypothetical protein
MSNQHLPQIKNNLYAFFQNAEEMQLLAHINASEQAPPAPSQEPYLLLLWHTFKSYFLMFLGIYSDDGSFVDAVEEYRITL